MPPEVGYAETSSATAKPTANTCSVPPMTHDQNDAGPKNMSPTTKVVNIDDVTAIELNCTPKHENRPRSRLSSCL